jgi:hypothetical protein
MSVLESLYSRNGYTVRGHPRLYETHRYKMEYCKKAREKNNEISELLNKDLRGEPQTLSRQQTDDNFAGGRNNTGRNVMGTYSVFSGSWVSRCQCVYDIWGQTSFTPDLKKCMLTSCSKGKP